MSDIQEEQKRLYKRAEENDRYLRCETITGEWWYKDMKTGEDLPLYSTPIKGLENDIKLLQEELEEEKRIEKESLKTIQNLEEENKKLKELCDKYEEEHNTEFKIWKDERYQLLDYKSRNEKAIEYINKYKNQNWYRESRFTEELLDILQGVDKE